MGHATLKLSDCSFSRALLPGEYLGRALVANQEIFDISCDNKSQILMGISGRRFNAFDLNQIFSNGVYFAARFVQKSVAQSDGHAHTAIISRAPTYANDYFTRAGLYGTVHQLSRSV